MSDDVPPHSLEAEQALLGAILISSTVMRTVVDSVADDDFYRYAHRLVWNAMRHLHEREDAIDLVGLRAVLSRNGDLDSVGGPAYIARLTDGVPRSLNASAYAKIITAHADRRRLQAVCRTGIETIVSEDAPADCVISLVDQLRQAVRGSGVRGIALRESIQDLMGELDNPAPVSRTGLPTLDRLGCGFRPGELTLLCGRPSSGKTALALHLATVVAKQQTPVWFASLEMRHTQLSMRLVSSESSVPFSKLRSGESLSASEYHRMASGVERLSPLPVLVDDSPGMGLGDLRQLVVSHQTSNRHGVLVVDYLQLLSAPAGSRGYKNRVAEVGAISRGLKGLAHDTGISVLALSQMSRSVETRGRGGVPQLSDLRDSGELEQDADVVLAIYRESQYDDEAPADHSCLKVLKNRQGPIGTVGLTFAASLQQFTERELTDTPVEKQAEQVARNW